MGEFTNILTYRVQRATYPLPRHLPRLMILLRLFSLPHISWNKPASRRKMGCGVGSSNLRSAFRRCLCPAVSLAYSQPACGTFTYRSHISDRAALIVEQATYQPRCRMYSRLKDSQKDFCPSHPKPFPSFSVNRCLAPPVRPCRTCPESG